MKKSFLFGLLILIQITTTLFAACSGTSTTGTSSKPAQTTTSKVTTTQSAATSTASAIKANWWDKFGTPQYGGKITYASSGLRGVNFDTASFVGEENCIWFESLFEPDWTLSPDVWFMSSNFAPDQYVGGNLVESWTQIDPTTLSLKVRQGIKWQDKAPVNGREFTAYDIQAHYERVLGQGMWSGPLPMYISATANWASATATDKYTVLFKFKQASAQNFQSIADRVSMNQIEAPEFVALAGPPATSAPAAGGGGPPGGGPGGGPPPVDTNSPLQDWHNAVGTGPWMLKEYIDGSAYNYVKNPTYWGTDPRHPENKTPYADALSMLVIGDESTRSAAMRTGKIDTLGGGGNTTVSWQQAKTLLGSNMDFQNVKVPGGGVGLSMRLDKAPFTDIRVRQALDMSLDRPAIASGVYGGNATGIPVGMTTTAMKGYAFPYDEWPQSLKDEYKYDPEAAKKLLAEAGYPAGFKTDVVTGSADTQALQAIKAYFLEIGVDMEIRAMDSISAEAFVRDGKHDAFAVGGAGQNFPPTRAIDASFYSKNGTYAYGLVYPNGDAGYDALHDQFWAATDATEAMKIFQQADKYVIEKHWVISPGESFTFVIWQPWLKGYSGEATQWNQGVLWSRVWVDASLKK